MVKMYTLILKGLITLVMLTSNLTLIKRRFILERLLELHRSLHPGRSQVQIARDAIVRDADFGQLVHSGTCGRFLAGSHVLQSLSNNPWAAITCCQACSLRSMLQLALAGLVEGSWCTCKPRPCRARACLALSPPLCATATSCGQRCLSAAKSFTCGWRMALSRLPWRSQLAYLSNFFLGHTWLLL